MEQKDPFESFKVAWQTLEGGRVEELPAGADPAPAAQLLLWQSSFFEQGCPLAFLAEAAKGAAAPGAGDVDDDAKKDIYILFLF